MDYIESIIDRVNIALSVCVCVTNYRCIGPGRRSAWIREQCGLYILYYTRVGGAPLADGQQGRVRSVDSPE